MLAFSRIHCTVFALPLAALLAPLVAAGNVSETKLVTASGVGGDAIGWNGAGLAADGDVLVVGAPLDANGGALDSNEGSATVFRWNGAGWVEEQEIHSSTASSGDLFGFSVSVSGDVIVVGATDDDLGLAFDTGTATVFRFNGSSWIEEQVLALAGGLPGDAFGYSVSVDADVLVVGAPGTDLAFSTGSGLAVVYRWNGTRWLLQQVIGSSTGEGFVFFGAAVSVSGDVVAVGSSFDDIAGEVRAGSVSMFRWNGLNWVLTQTLLSSEPAANDKFGARVSMSDDVVVVGALNDDVGFHPDQGSATAFRWNGTAWVEEQLIVSGTGLNGDHFGNSVSVRGDLLAVGALADQIGPQLDRGSAALFRWDGSTWVELPQLTASDGVAGDRFGSSVAIVAPVTGPGSGQRVIVGAPFHDVGGNTDQGVLYDYDLSRWADLGGGTAGIVGTPFLCGNGTLQGGSTYTLELSRANPGTLTVAWISMAPTPISAAGGTVHAHPFQSQHLFVTSPGGNVAAVASWPPGMPSGTNVWFQFFVADPSSPHGLTLSNGLRATTR